MNTESKCLECGIEIETGIVCPPCQEILDGHPTGQYSKENLCQRNTMKL